MQNHYQLLQPGGVYHIFNRANGNEKLFLCDENYRYFIYKYRQYIAPVAETFAWCLLPNHFHFLIQIKREEDLKAHYGEVKKNKAYESGRLPDFVMERFSNWLNAYTKAFNKVYDRKGSLFTDYLRRVPVMTNQQFAATVFYIHKNPVHHGLCLSIKDWWWCSYIEYVKKQYKIVSPNPVLKFFGGTAPFETFHQQPVSLKDAIILE